MKKINPFLWFDSEAEQAAEFYVGIFKNSKIGKIARYGEEAAQKTGRPAGSVMTVEFTLDRVEFVALNGGPQFKFTEAISFAVNCETQDEIDYFWEKLSADGGSPRPAREARLLPAIFEYVIIRVDSARFDSTPVERLNSRP